MNETDWGGPTIGVILEREKKQKIRKLELPKEPNAVEKLNELNWLIQSYDRKDQALVWRPRGSGAFKVKFGDDVKVVDAITYFGLERYFRLSDGTIINQDEAHLLSVS